MVSEKTFRTLLIILFTITHVTVSCFLIPLYKGSVEKTYITHIEQQEIHINTLIHSKFSIPVTLTAYNAEESQTDSTPTITASNRKVREGWCALSRDIENTMSLKFGDIIVVSIDGQFYGNYEFQDRMHKRKTKQVDLFMNSRQEALNFGVKKGKIQIRRHHRQSQ